MQQVKDLRERFNAQRQWLQIGLLSASILAPLINRWNELRAMERARALREETEERLKSLRAAAPWNRRAVQQQVEEVIEQIDERLPRRRPAPRSSTIIWMIGVGVGVVAAGVGTYVLLKRRLDAYRENEEPFVPLPFRRPSATATTRPNTPITAQPLTAPAYDAEATPASADVSAPADESDGERQPIGVTDVEDAAFIGNIRTQAYHLPDDDNLPTEENRIYFASEDEAQAAGYHRAGEEIGAGENSRAE